MTLREGGQVPYNFEIVVRVGKFDISCKSSPPIIDLIMKEQILKLGGLTYKSKSPHCSRPKIQPIKKKDWDSGAYWFRQVNRSIDRIDWLI